MTDIATYKKLLGEFVRLPSISTDPEYKEAITETVTWLRNLLTKNHFQVETWEGSQSNPVIFATHSSDPDKETLLLYGHYDVQPASLEDGWEDDPFTLVEKEGKLLARGVVDNKGQILIHLATIFKLIQQNNLRYNIKLIIEGDEETGSPDIAEIIADNKDLLSCDHILISDGELAGRTPAVEASLRGIFNFKLTYQTANTNLHSGIYGGAHPNAAHELTKLISLMRNERNEVTIPGFYDDVRKITEEQRENNQKLYNSDQDILNLTGGQKLIPLPGFDFYTQTGLQPALEVTGLKSGYIGEGFASIIPATAEAKINIRLVANQSPERVAQLVKTFIEKNTPSYVTWNMDLDLMVKPVSLNVTSQKHQETKEILEKAYGLSPVTKYVGGSIPIVLYFQEILGIDPILVPLANEDCQMHGANENFDLALLEKGLTFSHLFFSTQLESPILRKLGALTHRRKPNSKEYHRVF